MRTRRNCRSPGRIRWSRASDFSDSTLHHEDWQFYDFRPTDLNEDWEDEWFDFPDMTVSDEFLYITTNSFDTQGTEDSEDDDFARAVAIRLPLGTLKARLHRAREALRGKLLRCGVRP